MKIFHSLHFNEFYFAYLKWQIVFINGLCCFVQTDTRDFFFAPYNCIVGKEKDRCSVLRGSTEYLQQLLTKSKSWQHI